jgi:hypothetical protein
MTDGPMIIGVEPLDADIPQIIEMTNQLEEVLIFYQAEWIAANELLEGLGYPSHPKDEYGDGVFMKLEERIRRAVNEAT